MRQTTAIKRTTKPAAAKRIEIPSPAGTSAKNEEFLRKVAEKAYELYVARGCQHGYDVEDWVAAEKIVRGA